MLLALIVDALSTAILAEELTRKPKKEHCDAIISLTATRGPVMAVPKSISPSRLILLAFSLLALTVVEFKVVIVPVVEPKVVIVPVVDLTSSAVISFDTERFCIDKLVVDVIRLFAGVSLCPYQ